LLSGVQQSNNLHHDWTRRRLRECLGSVSHHTIAVLGLTYKPGTDTLRRSAAVELCYWLHEQGATVQAFDPAVNALPESLTPVIRLAASAETALEHSDALVIATAWPDFTALSPAEVLNNMRRAIVIDPARHLQSAVVDDPRILYFAVGKGAARTSPADTKE
jgi:UDPglucose 6-dehydrogenase